MNICYHGPLRDHSGYGEANRHAVAALMAAGVNVQAKLVSYTVDGSDFGTLGATITEALNTECDYKIKILHTTPNVFNGMLEKGKYHIAHFFWETDKVPEQFAAGLQLVDEIWTGSEANKAAIEKAGVTKPVFVFPQAIETERDWPEPYELPNFPTDGYLFYSIFEWIDRKNPAGLLNAYWQEFQNGEKVGLLIKTYFKNFTFENKKFIVREIERLKAESGLTKFPPIYLYQDLMDRRHIMRLHKTGDCYVLPHRGEGWGVPEVEAMLAGNPVIATAYGGVNEYLTHGVTAMLLPYEMVPVRGMEHSAVWYSRDQNWAEPDLNTLKMMLRRSYEQQDIAAEIGATGRNYAVERFNLKTVGKEMADRLEVISSGL